MNRMHRTVWVKPFGSWANQDDRDGVAGYKATTAHAGIGLGRTLMLREHTSFTPSVRADYTWIRDQPYTESGADALLSTFSAQVPNHPEWMDAQYRLPAADVRQRTGYPEDLPLRQAAAARSSDACNCAA
ncbi:autotransporter outer membrane beta-barrel domain-containing protein [Microvirgula curvata]